MRLQQSNPAIESLMQHARKIRSQLIENSYETQTPHLGSCLSCVDILVVAYFYALKINPTKPLDADRDRFVLSKGHAAPTLFHILAMRGFYPETMLLNYGQDGGIFAEHPPTPDKLPGIEAATGSLGHGLPIALGMALSARIQKRNFKVLALLGDGECNEGSVWEAAMLAAAQKVAHLGVIVDFNKWQATGRSKEIMSIEPFADKWRAFGWSAYEVDGHDMEALVALLSKFPDGSGKPVAIIAHTIKGKGVSFMEDDNNWHYRIPSADEVIKAKVELGIVV